MNKTALILATTLLASLPAMARTSPHETVSTSVEGDRVMVVYGRPYTKSPKTGEMRKIWGGLVPYGKIWRTGADEATLLIVQKPIMIEGKTVPAGAYTLWTLPKSDSSAELIINKEIGQWGEDHSGSPYHERQDLVRVPLKEENLETPVDQFTMGVDKNPSGGGTLTMSWEKTRYYVPFTVKK
jgi:hypothetical protein